MLVCLFAGWVGCHTLPEAKLQRFEFTKPEMGVPFRMVLYAPDHRTAETASKAAFQRIEELNQIMSDYEPDSELSLLSRTSGSGKAVPVSADLWKVLVCAQEFSKRSNGAFDVSVGPVISLWRKARREGKLPDASKLEVARNAVGWRFLKLNHRQRTVSLQVPNMRLDLGAIAKGYAVQEAIRTLREHGVTSCLVSGGGDMAVGDAPPGKPGWKVEVTSLNDPNAPPPRYAYIANRGLATSGDLFQFVTIDGVRYSHIVDPRTGIGLTDHSQVTVIARDGMTADALSTTLSVLGPEQGMKLLETFPAAAGVVARKPAEEYRFYVSRRFHRYEEARSR